VIPLSDALLILTGAAVVMFALGWWGCKAVGPAGWQEGYDDGRQEAIGTRIADSWDREFGRPDLGVFVDTVLTYAYAADPEPEPIPVEGQVVARGEPGIVVPRLAFAPEPWTILDDPATGERLPTVDEVRDSADYWLWRTEMSGLIDGAAAWYDEAFGTGQFRAVA
jgi:hypothetical protein